MATARRCAFGCGLLAALLCLPLPLAARSPPSRQTLLGQIEALDRRLVAAEEALRRSEHARERIEGRLADAHSAQAATELHHTEAAQALGRRLGALMRQPAGLRWALLSGSASLATQVEDARLMRAIARHDHALWASVAATREQLDTTIAAEQEQRLALSAHEARLREVRDKLGLERLRRAEMLRDLETRLEQRTQLACEQRQAQQQLGRLAKRRMAGARPAARRLARQWGKLPWPAKGAVRVAYGERVELTFGTSTNHNGLDIAAPAGSRVQAVADGQVVWADWLHGYGQVVIVDHHDGYHAVLAHLARTDVKRGQRVAQGDALGVVGDSGSLRGTVLYFEIRKRGAAINPLPALGRSGA